MKRIYKGAIALTIAGVVAGSMFYACTKDGNEKNRKDALPTGTTALSEYENYVPETATVYEKLVQIMKCVNNPNGNHMPNMELKEAVWFLEAFFNIGVCSHQQYAMDSVIGRQEYVISVPVASWNNEQIMLDGNVLQTRYINLVDDIISGLCSEYTINFVDMYVVSTNPDANEVVLGITALYGRKSHKSFAVEKIASPSHYPGKLLCPVPHLRFSPRAIELPVRDPGMEATINQDRIPYVVGLHNVYNYMDDDMITVPIYRELVARMNNNLILLKAGTWEQFATGYRDDIYRNLPYYENFLPNNSPLQVYAPLYAFCEVHFDKTTIVDPIGLVYEGEAYHRFGLEYVHHISCLNPAMDWSSIRYYKLVAGW